MLTEKSDNLGKFIRGVFPYLLIIEAKNDDSLSFFLW